MRSLKSTTIQFGMVVMPVKLYPATQDKSVSLFNQIHATCGTRIKMPKTCPRCDRPVDASEIVKGYSLGKVKGEEQFIIITDDELEALPLETASNIAIQGFIPEKMITDPRWYEECYFISPEETAKRPFVLFAKAMETTGMVGVAKVCLKSQKEHLCIIRHFDGMLLLQTLHWADELRDYSEIRVSANISDKELELAQTLIKAMAKDIDLANFRDEYREAVMELVAAKQEGKPTPAPSTQPKIETDMVEALLQSLKMAGAK